MASVVDMTLDKYHALREIANRGQDELLSLAIKSIVIEHGITLSNLPKQMREDVRNYIFDTNSSDYTAMMQRPTVRNFEKLSMERVIYDACIDILHAEDDYE